VLEVLYVLGYPDDKIESAVARLVCSIDSLRGQYVKPVVFNASAQCVHSKISAAKQAVLYYWHPISGPFRKPLCINYAVKNYISGKYFLFSDIDLVYQHDYADKMNKHIPDAGSVRVVPYNFNIYADLLSSNYADLITLNKSAGGFAHGNGLIHRDSFVKVRGFDEHYCMYGPEDDDFNKRVGFIDKVIYDKDIVTAHLNHGEGHIQAAKDAGFYKSNHDYYAERMKTLSAETIVANDDGWGKL